MFTSIVLLIFVSFEVGFCLSFLPLTSFVRLSVAIGNALTKVEHRPREFETGPNGNIVINYGGIPDPRGHPPVFGLLRRKRPRPSASGDHDLSNALPTASWAENTRDPAYSKPKPLRVVDVDAMNEDYDYASYERSQPSPVVDQDAPVVSTTPKPQIRKPKRAKSKRISLVEFLTQSIDELIRPPKGVALPHASRVFPAKAHGIASFQPPKKWVDVDAYVRPSASSRPSAAFRNANHAAKMGPSGRSTPQRAAIAGGAKSWAEFEKFASAAFTADAVGSAGEKSTSGGGAQWTAASIDNRPSATANGDLPLPECYRSPQTGLLCCNRVLEELIYRTDDLMINGNVNKCNSNIFSELLKNNAEKQFQTTFEIVVANGPLAAQTRFKDNLLCQVITNGKHVLIYGTPEPYEVAPYNRREPLGL